MTRSLYKSIELFLKRIRKTHPSTKGILIAINWPNSRFIFSTGELKECKNAIVDHLKKEHVEQPLS
jgi:hypothetical protein